MTLKKVYKAALLVIVLLVMFGCGTTSGFVPAPPPVRSKNVVNIHQLKVQDSAQLMSISSPLISVDYKENGAGLGNVVSEEVTLPNGKKGSMSSVVWGDWTDASITLVNYYEGWTENLVGGFIIVEFKEASVFQLVTGNARYTIDRSQVLLTYSQDATGELVLNQVEYVEKWGPANEELNLGGFAIWTDDFEKLLPASFLKWGSWEINGTPANQVKELIESAMTAAENGVDPEYKSVDEDSTSELIGRQTGQQLYKLGVPYGWIDVDYSNTWGRQPNTEFIGKGSLSRILWYFGDKEYYLVVLSPKISSIGSALYIFTNSKATADMLGTQANADAPTKLYDDLANGSYDGVILAMHAIGDIGIMTASAGDSTVNVGDSGGVRWSTLGPVTYEKLELATNLLALLGPAQYQTGLYYAYKQGSGSGLSYYLAALRLLYAPTETVITTYGQDVGVLDRVLIPDLYYLGILP